MKRCYKRICSLLLLLTVFALPFLSGCSTDERHSEIIINNFTADEIYFIAGEESTITFTADIEGAVSTVNLCTENDTVVGTMQDDGTNGDVAASDGTYTCVLTTTFESEVSEEYYVRTDNNKSDSITVYSFDTPKTEEEAEKEKQKAEKIQNNIYNIEEPYKDSNGYVDPDSVDKIISGVEDYLKQEKTKGNILLYEADENSVYVKFKSGIGYVYQPALDKVSEGGDDVSLTFSAYQPHPDVAFDEVSNIAVKLADERKSTATTYKAEEVTLSLIKSLPSNQVIFWNGHGGYGPIVKSFLGSGESFDWSAWFWDTTYYWDCVQDRIICRSTEHQKDLACVTSKFIDYYCKDLSNDLILLVSCHSGQNSKLADSFINKGATAVLGFTDTVYTEYCCNIGIYTLVYMTWVNADTKNYNTLLQALEKAKSDLGNDDIEYAKEHPDTFKTLKKEVASPVIFGGTKAEEYRLGDYVPITVDSFTLPENLILTIGQTDLITPKVEPENAEGYTIKWTSSDESVATVNPTGEQCIVASHAKGTATITAELESGGKTITKSTEVRVASKGRDTVLVLDVSGSMSGTPMNEMKKSAVKFCEDLLTDEYNNRVGVVCFDNGINTYDLTNDINGLTSYINGLSTGGATNMEEALANAEYMLDNSGNTEHIKNIVIMADGLPNRGKKSTSGSSGIQSGNGINTSSEYADAVVDTAQLIMQKYNMYSLGFFHSLSSSDYDNCKLLMSKLTNMPEGYHEVQKAEDLQFEFGDIATNITDGSKIVINIACPVDVTISYGGETLSSSSESFNDETSFGTLQLLGDDKDIKVLSLDRDKQYDVNLTGTGEGTMDYSVNYVNADDEITDYRNFSSVPITKTTVINSSTENSTTVNLNIDNDGDGNVDVVWEAGSKGEGKISVDNTETTAPETTEVPSTVEVTEPVKETENDDDGTMLILIISVCSLLALGLIALIVVLVNVKNKEKYDSTEIPIVQSERAVTEDRKVQDEKQEKEAEKSDATIEILTGSMAGMKIPLSDGEILTLGKNPTVCQVVFTSDYTGVSRMHCTVSYSSSSKKFFVTDSSSNGTYLASKRRLAKGKRTSIISGEMIYLCDERCTIRLLSE